MNQLYNDMNQSTFPQRLQQFAQSFKGNPREQVQQLLNSGKVSQEQYNRAVQIANQWQRMLGGRF